MLKLMRGGRMSITMQQSFMCKICLFHKLSKIIIYVIESMKRILFFCYKWHVSFLICAGLRRSHIHDHSRTRKKELFTEEINNSGKLAQKIAEQAQDITEQIHCNTIQIKII